MHARPRTARILAASLAALLTPWGAMAQSAAPGAGPRPASPRPADAPPAPAPTAPPAPPAEPTPAGSPDRAKTDGPAEEIKADPALPAGKELQERFIAATGGREAYAKAKAQVLKGTVEVPAANLKGTMQVWVQSPDKARTILTLPSVGVTEQGSDGTIVWENSDVKGPRLVTGQERATILRSFSPAAETGLAELYPRIDTVAVEPVDGKDAYKVVFHGGPEPRRTRWYAKESGLVVRQLDTVRTELGPVTADSLVSDYQDAAGLKTARTLRQRLLGLVEMVVRIESVESPESIPAERFDPPEEVKALARRAAEKGGGDPAPAGAGPAAPAKPRF